MASTPDPQRGGLDAQVAQSNAAAATRAADAPAAAGAVGADVGTARGGSSSGATSAAASTGVPSGARPTAWSAHPHGVGHGAERDGTPHGGASESATEPQAPALLASWLGTEAFAPCLDRQLRRRDAILGGEAREILYFVEHPPTLTLGRRGTRADILWSDDLLSAAGIAVAETPRGGEVTLHAPGQLVIYPIVRVGRAIRAHIVALGEATARWCESEGLAGCEFRMEVPGVWRGDRKLASIGVHVSRGIAVQGLSINVFPEPRLFGALVSCGMPDVQMTSVTHELAAIGATEAAAALAATPLAEIASRWSRFYAAHVGRNPTWVTGDPA